MTWLPPSHHWYWHRCTTNWERYYCATLEAGDQGSQDSFPPPMAVAAEHTLLPGDFGPMEDLLADGVIPQRDVLLASAVGAQHLLRPLRELAGDFSVHEATPYRWISWEQSVAVRRWLHSHPLSVLRGTSGTE